MCISISYIPSLSGGPGLPYIHIVSLYTLYLKIQTLGSWVDSDDDDDDGDDDDDDSDDDDDDDDSMNL